MREGERERGSERERERVQSAATVMMDEGEDENKS